MSGVPDYALESTIDFKFTSRSFSTGVPTTLAGTPAVEIYEDNSVTQITAAETLTVDFDSVTGLNNLRVVATAANGFEAGKSYHAVISTGTVGGVSVVGEVVAQFSIQRSPVNWANVTAPTTAVDLSATDIQLVDTATTAGSVTAGVTLANGAITDASLAGNMEIVFETDFATNYNTTRNAWATNAQDFVGTSAADPFNGQVVAASVTAGVTLAAGAITDASLAGNMEIVFETDFATNYNATRNAWVTNAQDFVGTTAADPFNGQVVSASVTGAVGSVTAGVTLANGAITDASLAGNMEIVFETDFATNYNATRNAWATNVQDFVGTAAADPFNGQVVAASVTGAVGSVTGAVGSVTGNVGGNVTGSVGALTSAAITDVWATDTLTEAYAADGAEATPAQLLYMLLSAVSEFAIASTTITCKKLDGSTTAMTFTLDDASTPTSRTRAS
jgi:hypothetical protein